MSVKAVVDTVATTIGAVGAGGALAVAALAYRRQSLDRHRDQASKVGAWIEREYMGSWGAPRSVIRAESLRVRNASSQPIFRVVVAVGDGPGELGVVQTQRFATLPPDADESVPLHQSVRVVDIAEPPLGLTMWFVDSAGVSWKRDSRNGRLSEAEPPQQPDDDGP